MQKQISETNWADYLMTFARENEGKMVKMYVENGGEGKNLIGHDPLISFEGDCDGDIVNGVKIVVGEEGDKPNNVFHLVPSPRSMEVEERDDGTIAKIMLESNTGERTTLEMDEE